MVINDKSNTQYNLADGETGVTVLSIWFLEKTRGLVVLLRGADNNKSVHKALRANPND